jgi:hypothetical protein
MRTKTTIHRDLLEDALDDSANDWDYGDIRDEYSGRGMYGDTCLGLVFRRYKDTFAFFVSVAALDEPLARVLAAKACWDSMGRDVIVYFPGVQLED